MKSPTCLLVCTEGADGSFAGLGLCPRAGGAGRRLHYGGQKLEQRTPGFVPGVVRWAQRQDMAPYLVQARPQLVAIRSSPLELSALGNRGVKLRLQLIVEGALLAGKSPVPTAPQDLRLPPIDDSAKEEHRDPEPGRRKEHDGIERSRCKVGNDRESGERDDPTQRGDQRSTRPEPHGSPKDRWCHDRH